MHPISTPNAWSRNTSSRPTCSEPATANDSRCSLHSAVCRTVQTAVGRPHLGRTAGSLGAGRERIGFLTCRTGTHLDLLRPIIARRQKEPVVPLAWLQL